jgi:hypothetical protein
MQQEIVKVRAKKKIQMKSNSKARFLSVLLLLSIAITSIGCGKKEFIEKIADFQSGVEDTTTATSIYYSELNSFERDLYLQERLYDPTQKVERKDANQVPTALVGQTFNAQSIKARTDAIQLLGLYGKRLAELAGNDAPTRFATGTQSIGSNFTKLGGTFSALTGDATAAKYTAPLKALGTIFGVIGQSILESKRDAALTKAVKDAAPEVRIIIDLLEKDLENVIGPLRETGTDQALAQVILDYNNKRTTMTFEERKKALDEIRRSQDRFDIALAFNPSELMSSMREAHEALVKYASSKRTPQSLAELVNALDAFKERAAVIATAVLELRNLRRTT